MWYVNWPHEVPGGTIWHLPVRAMFASAALVLQLRKIHGRVKRFRPGTIVQLRMYIFSALASDHVGPTHDDTSLSQCSWSFFFLSSASSILPVLSLMAMT